MRSNGRMAKWFRALTPVALRAPSVSALNHKRPAGEQSPMHHHKRKEQKVLTDADHYLTLRELCVASLRSDRHEIGMTDRHHRNAQHDEVEFWLDDSSRRPGLVAVEVQVTKTGGTF